MKNRTFGACNKPDSKASGVDQVDDAMLHLIRLRVQHSSLWTKRNRLGCLQASNRKGVRHESWALWK